MLKPFIFIILIFCTYNVVGQFQIDAIAGVNRSTLHYSKSDIIDYKSINQWYVGVSPSFNMDKWKLSGELQYSNKGSKYNDGSNNQSLQIKYVDLLVEVSREIFPHISLGAGIYSGVNVDENIKFNNGSRSKPIINFANKTDHGLTAKTEITFGRFSGIIRYTISAFSMSDIIFTDNDGRALDTGVFRNGVFQVGLGYRLLGS